MVDRANQLFRRPEEIPDTYYFMWMQVGRAYFEPLLDYDIYGAIAAYDKDVLLIHGDADNIVPLSYSQRALQAYPSAELQVIPGGRPRFFRRYGRAGRRLHAGIPGGTPQLIRDGKSAGKDKTQRRNLPGITSMSHSSSSRRSAATCSASKPCRNIRAATIPFWNLPMKKRRPTPGRNLRHKLKILTTTM